MDFTSIVNKKLFNYEKTTCCLLVTKVSSDEKQPCVLALVESQAEYGIFLYKCTKVPSSKPDDLELDVVLPVNLDFKSTIASQPAGSQQGITSFTVQLVSGKTSVSLDLPQNEQAKLFLSELKRTRQVYSQNVSFGITSYFTWIEKYTKSNAVETSNPFVDDIFDPSASNKKDGWPFSQILQPNVGKHCPVVKDTSAIEHAASTPDLVSMSDSGSFQDSLQLPQTETEQSMRRSYDSMDNLGTSGAVNNETVVSHRDHLIKHFMKQREEEYIEIQTYRLFCGTWNTNGQSASAPIKAWLSPQEDDIAPDIYVVGFQELDLSKNAYIFTESPKEEEWYKKVREGLHHKTRYRKVKLVRLVGMMIVVFVKWELSNYIYDVMWDTVGTGVLGMMGNKGGVGVRFSFHDSTIAFVNSHLAAHVEEYDRRNKDFRDISSRMIFGKTKERGEYTIADHDLVFWVGDLNYRLSDVSNERAKQLISEGRLNDLMNYDQLCRQIALKKVFLDYVEGRVNFIPTYRYDPGTDNWDSSEKMRIPAWCDRILWRGKNVRQLKYRSHNECRVSDHKPVSAVFDIGVKVINKKQYRSVYEDIMKMLDRMENEFLPQVILDFTDVQFADVKFIEPQSKTITVTNTGQGPVQFEFINKPNDTVFCKPWLSIVPSKGIIDVGQKCEIQLEMYVESSTAAALNIGEDRMEDILVLHLEGGKDLFVTVGGNYIPSSFGLSVENLVNMFAPIRKLPPEQLTHLAKRGEVSSDRPLDIPKEIYWLVDYLYKYGMQQENLFQLSGRHSEIQEIRDCLDQGTPQDITGQVHSVAEALLVFLEALAQPVIPFKYYYKCLECYSNFTACKQVLADMPDCHRTLFKYLCAFLRELLRFSTQNSLDAKSVARLFSGLLLRPPPLMQGLAMSAADRKASSREEENKRCAFIYHFLVNEYDGMFVHAKLKGALVPWPVEVVDVTREKYIVFIKSDEAHDEQTRLDDQKRWLDQEIEKVVQQRQAVEDVQKELVKREDAIAKKEAMLAERSELEIKKLRSSQLLNNNIVKVSSNLDVIDRKIEEKSHEMARTPRGEVQSKLKEELGKLQHGRDTIKKQREVLDGKLQEGAILTPQEERRLIELEEAIDALNAAIDYRNEQIDNKQQHIRNSFNSQSDDLMSKLRTLSSNETKILLSKYFEKVIDMRESERKLQQQCSELEVHIDEQERMIKELEGSMQRGGLETDRRLTLQQQDYEKKLQLMVRQLAESEKDLKAEIREKDKDIFYFKSKCRDMTKKLREVAAGGSVGALDTDRSDRSTENGEGDQHHREHSHRDPTSREPSHREPTPRENPPHRDPTPRETAAKSLNPRPPSTSSRSGSGSAKNGENPDKSARDGSGPIKISRKHLSRVSQEEISLRKSAAERSGTPRDSLDTGKNPWA